MCCFLATTLLKYAYTCVHNVRYICNVIKICLTLMASKYAQFPSDVINKMQCDDVNTCHFQKVSFFFRNPLLQEIYAFVRMSNNMKLKQRKTMPSTTNWVGKHAYDSLLCHNDTGWNPLIHAQTQFWVNFEMTKCCGYLEYKVKVIKIG